MKASGDGKLMHELRATVGMGEGTVSAINLRRV